MKLHILLQLAGLTHFGILIASVQVPKLLDWKTGLAAVPTFLRTLFWVYGVFIVMTIFALGTITLVNAEELVRGGTLARSFSTFAAIFWAGRLAVQLWVFDASAYLTTMGRRIGYQFLTLGFIGLTIVYTWAAIAPHFTLNF